MVPFGTWIPAVHTPNIGDFHAEDSKHLFDFIGRWWNHGNNRIYKRIGDARLPRHHRLHGGHSKRGKKLLLTKRKIGGRHRDGPTFAFRWMIFSKRSVIGIGSAPQADTSQKNSIR